MGDAHFDLRGLFRAVEAELEERGLSRAAMAREVGVSSSTIRRYADVDDAEADGVLAVIGWLGVAPEDYVDSDDVAGEPLPPAGSGHVRVDMDLVATAKGEAGGAHGRTRTSIQQLVEVARRSGQPVASLTRVSDV